MEIRHPHRGPVCSLVDLMSPVWILLSLLPLVRAGALGGSSEMLVVAEDGVGMGWSGRKRNGPPRPGRF